MKRTTIIPLLLCVSSVFAASQTESFPAVQSANDGYIFATNAGRSGPTLKFCPPGNYYAEISGKDGKGCGPNGEGSWFQGKHDTKKVVDSINMQEFLDEKFGAGKVIAVGASPWSTSNATSVIFYRFKK